MLELFALEVTLPVAGLVFGSRFARSRLRLRAERALRRHEAARYAACLRNIDRLEHELGIGLTNEQPTEKERREQVRQIQRELLYGKPHYMGNYAMTAIPTHPLRPIFDHVFQPGVVWTVDDPGDIRDLH